VAAFNGADVAEVPLPATYVADRDGLVHCACTEDAMRPSDCG
jgi:hypothetical protein